MVSLTDLIVGKYKISVRKEALSKVSSYLLRKGISAKFFSDGTFFISERGYILLKSEFGDEINLVEKKYGGRELFRKAKSKIPSLITLVLCIFAFSLSNLVVWDVRISGNENMTDSEIIEILGKEGLSVGGMWNRMDIGMIEVRTLSENKGLAWININRRGTVAYVDVVESKLFYNSIENSENVGNIVAECDCVIEDIVVNKGTQIVKVGDVVRKGDVLISGIVETEGGTVICHAEGEVMGKCIEYIEGSAESVEETLTGYEKHINKININFLNFRANILKKYRNRDGVYDIIVEKQNFVTDNGKKLPLGITREYVLIPIVKSVSFSDADMIRLAFSRHKDKLDEFSRTNELYSIATSSEYTDSGYCVRSRVVYVQDVGAFSEIKTD